MSLNTFSNIVARAPAQPLLHIRTVEGVQLESRNQVPQLEERENSFVDVVARQCTFVYIQYRMQF